MSVEDVCSCPNISVCVNMINSKEIVCLIIMKYITIYLKSKPCSNREIFIKNRLYLHYRVYCVMGKLLLREVIYVTV